MAEEKILLTYETLYELVRREKSKEELQPLDANFFNSLVEYLKEKNLLYEESLKKNDIFSVADRERLATQLANILKLVRDLYERREKKIIALAINKSRTNSSIIDTSNLLAEERAFFNSLVGVLDEYRKGVLGSILELRLPTIAGEHSKSITDQSNSTEPSPDSSLEGQKRSDVEATSSEQKKTALVTFIQPVPQLVGPELETYGPFEPGSKAYLPNDLAAILVEQKKALFSEEENEP
ncbi:MAG: hypothetical protein QW559_00375 [Candidatus Woesearchaeota archaeon]